MQASAAAQREQLQDGRPQRAQQASGPGLTAILERVRGQQRAQPPPEAGLEHAVRPQVVVEDARRARVRQDVRIPLQPD